LNTTFYKTWTSCSKMPRAKFRKRISFILLIMFYLLLNLLRYEPRKYHVGVSLVIIEDWIRPLKKMHRWMAHLLLKSMAIRSKVNNVIAPTWVVYLIKDRSMTQHNRMEHWTTKLQIDS
jgi:hypothetical protein